MDMLLKPEDITEDIVVIKINQLYRKGMSEKELYEATRGVWKRRIESVEKAKYCLAVAKGEVVEVYRIFSWHPAGTNPMETRKMDASHYEGRIEFVGELAEEAIREKYIGKSVKELYKKGEANPLKTFFVDGVKSDEGQKKVLDDINIARKPKEVMQDGRIVCPRCQMNFQKSPRCPECGQLIDY